MRRELIGGGSCATRRDHAEHVLWVRRRGRSRRARRPVPPSYSGRRTRRGCQSDEVPVPGRGALEPTGRGWRPLGEMYAVFGFLSAEVDTQRERHCETVHVWSRLVGEVRADTGRRYRRCLPGASCAPLHTVATPTVALQFPHGSLETSAGTIKSRIVFLLTIIIQFIGEANFYVVYVDTTSSSAD